MTIKAKRETFAELDSPSIVCGKCRFTSGLEGEWHEKDGRLVFTAAPDPQPRRGPDLFTCGECGAKFEHVSVHWNSKRLSEDVLAAVRATANKAREAEWDDLDLMECAEGLLCGMDEAGLPRLQAAR